jgi:hypothetical protein
MRTFWSCLLGTTLGVVLFLSPGEANAFCCARHSAPPAPRQTVMLQVCHPKTCCTKDVPVCIPCCVQGAPCARFQHTLLGHGKTVFTWPCGYHVTVRYTCCGGIRVVQRD